MADSRILYSSLRFWTELFVADRHVICQTTLSYAAIFGIREDLNLRGTEYNWLSSLFYFGFLAWAFPTNFLLQRLPIGTPSVRIFLKPPSSLTDLCSLGKYLGFNIFLWYVGDTIVM